MAFNIREKVRALIMALKQSLFIEGVVYLNFNSDTGEYTLSDFPSLDTVYTFDNGKPIKQ
jgi:hypothetical protein